MDKMNLPAAKPFDSYPHGAQQLMRAAERLFGERGVAGVTIRELLDAAGQANKSAVHHYFGSKEGLLQAVHEMRLPELEAARARWIERLPRRGESQHKELLAALFLPVLEVMDDRDLDAFSQFNLRLLHQGMSDQSFMRTAVASPATREIVDRLCACFPAIPLPVFRARMRLAVGVLLGGVAEWRLLGAGRNCPYPSLDIFWADVLLMASGVLAAPYADAAGFKVTVLRPARRKAPGTRSAEPAAALAAPVKKAGRPPGRKVVSGR